jgi:hypothetical protein
MNYEYNINIVWLVLILSEQQSSAYVKVLRKLFELRSDINLYENNHVDNCII